MATLDPAHLRRIMEEHADDFERVFGTDWRSMSFFGGGGRADDAMPGGSGFRVNGLEVWLGAKRSDDPLHSKAYRLCGEDYRVQTAAQSYRAALALERLYFWKIGGDGKRVYDRRFFSEGVAAALEHRKSRLRRRMVRVLKEDFAEA